MSVYKEGFHAVTGITLNSIRIFEDACDFGAPTRKGDSIFNWAKMLSEVYGVKETRQVWEGGVSIQFMLMDEWNTGDKYIFEISYNKCKTGMCKGYDGFISIIRVKTIRGNKNLDY